MFNIYNNYVSHSHGHSSIAVAVVEQRVFFVDFWEKYDNFFV